MTKQSTKPFARRFPRPRIPINPVLSFNSFFPRRPPPVPPLFESQRVVWPTSGRVAIAKALSCLPLNRESEVLVPAYHCPAMVEPIESIGARPKFFRVTESLQADFDDLKSQFTSRTAAVLIVHFFGFPEPRIAEIAEFCGANDVALIEDCAHVMCSDSSAHRLGQWGDFAVMSPMKFLPIYDGGTLIVNRQPLPLPDLNQGNLGFQLKALLDPLERSSFYHRLSPFWLVLRPALALKDTIWRLMKSRPKNSRRLMAFGPSSSQGAYGFQKEWANTRISWTSRLLLQSVSLHRVFTRRRLNFEAIVEQLSDIDGCQPLYRELPDDIVPYVVPVIFEDEEPIFRSLKAEGVPLFRWETLRHSSCHTSHFFSKHLFQFPCHQELSRGEINWMLMRIRRAIQLT